MQPASTATHLTEETLPKANEKVLYRMRIFKQIYTSTTIVIFTILGSFLRLFIGYYVGDSLKHPFYSDWLANSIGCLLMGIFVHNKMYFNEVLYIALTTGFCDPLTTFAGMIRSISMSVCNYWFDAVSMFFVSFVSIISAYKLGIHLSLLCEYIYAHINKKNTPNEGNELNLHTYTTDSAVNTPHNIKISGILVVINIIIIICFFVGYVLILVYTPHKTWKMGYGWPVLPTSFGSIIRWRLAKFSAQHFRIFPFGTFMVNLIGSVVAVSFLFADKSTFPALKVIDLMMVNGFLGSLTTVALFASEVARLPTKWAYLYTIASFVPTLVFGFLFVGLSNICSIRESIGCMP